MTDPIVDQFSNRYWKKIGSRMLEPVGTIVLILTSDSEVIKAKRNSYAQSYNNPEYVSVNYGHTVDNAEYWDYI